MRPFDDDCRPGFGPGFLRGWKGHRMQRGDFGPLLLHLLGERPMHGYEIIRTLEERSHGFWRPSAGSIYPTLQLLQEQELVSSTEVDGKKVYQLTPKGKQQVKDTPSPRSQFGGQHGHRMGQFKEIGQVLMVSLRQVMAEGTDEQLEAARVILQSAANDLDTLASSTHSTPPSHE